MEASLVIVLLAVLLLATAIVTTFTSRAFIRSLHDDRAFLRERVTDLERQLASHSWQDYAQVSTVPTPLARASEVVRNGWGEERLDEAYGENEDDVIENFLASNGVDLEGPTIA